MGVHQWAQEQLEQWLEQAQQRGETEQMALRALLSAVVERSKQVRSADDLAQELIYLSENLDDERDYAFMRP